MGGDCGAAAKTTEAGANVAAPTDPTNNLLVILLFISSPSRQITGCRSTLISGLEECEQFLVDPVLQRGAHSMRRALVHHEFGILDDLGG